MYGSMCSNGEQRDQQRNKNSERVMQVLNELSKNKQPIIIKDGIANICRTHPDYNYWINDWFSM
jgi:hypothetical protein